MGIWYRAGSAAVTNGSTAVSGTLTAWEVFARPGDAIRFGSDNRRYEIAAIPGNTSIVLATPYEGVTASGLTYEIETTSYRHQIPSDILERLREVLEGQTDVFLTTGAPLNSLGTEDSIAFDPVAKFLYVKGATTWGTPVPLGDVGPVGPRGRPGGLTYLFDTGTANADPGAGRLRLNNAALASATSLIISETDGLGANVGAFLATLDDSTNAVRGTLTLSSVAAPENFRIYNVTGALTDSGAFNVLPITHVAGNGTFTNSEEIALQFDRAGNVGATGNTGATGAPGGESVLMTFDTATADADPGPGLVRLNNAALASVTQAFIDEATPAAVNIAAWIDTWDDSTSTIKAVVTFARASAPAANFARYFLTAVVAATGYRKLTLSHIVSAGSLTTTASDLLVSVERIGNAGSSDAATASGAFAYTGTISPAQITADQNDYAPTGLATASVVRLSSDALRAINGLTGGATGRVLILHNVGAFQINLADEAAGSAAANRFALTRTVALLPDAAVMIQYDATSSRWRVLSEPPDPDELRRNVSATLTVGFSVTNPDLGTITTGTVTPDAAAGNYQFYTNNGAHTLAAPTTNTAIDILITNGASAGAITFSGFTVGALTGSPLTTTNGQHFLVQIRRINGVATYSVYALQ